MTSPCAACRRASDSRRAICPSCSWTVARTHSQTAEVQTSTFTGVEDEESERATSDEMFLLFGLAPIVGEKGAVVVERVLRQLARGNARAYRVEINRLTGKFIASIETPPLDPH